MKLEDTLKNIFEGVDILSEESREELTATFRKVLDEAKVEQEKAIRAELSERYAKDKKAIHAALEQFLEQELGEAVADFKSGIDEVDAMKKTLADKTVAVQEQAKAYVAQRLGAIEQVIEGVLEKELTELHESEKTNRRAYVTAMTEGKARLEEDRENFRKHGAAALEHIVNVMVQGTLDELREDIKAAREADFGREIYEAFMTSFRRQFFDSNKEFRAVVTDLKEAKAEVASIKKAATAKIQEATERATAAEAKANKVQESVVRARTINKMLEGLSGKSREKMKHLLESSETRNLKATYRKFMPIVLNEAKRAPKKQTRKIEETIVELKTGGQRTVNESATQDDDEIMNIQRLAGMSD